MRLLHLIERRQAKVAGGRLDNPDNSANAARPQVRLLSELSKLSALPGPERWPNMLRALSVAGVDLRAPADALGRLVEAGIVAEALALGWDARDLVGLWRFPPYTLPSRAGLIFSLYPGDMVRSLRATGCVIAIGGGNLRHIWRRASVRDVVLPWALPAGSPPGPEICPPGAIRHPASPGVQQEPKSNPTAKYGIPAHGGERGE